MKTKIYEKIPCEKENQRVTQKVKQSFLYVSYYFMFNNYFYTHYCLNCDTIF